MKVSIYLAKNSLDTPNPVQNVIFIGKPNG